MFIAGEFQKVSLPIFQEGLLQAGHDRSLPEAKKALSDLILPKRATAGSAGYDFRAPFGFSLPPGESVNIPTGVRVRIEEGWWLAIFPRSGHGFRYRIQLDNTVGVIDSDFYHATGEGHIFIKLTNDGRAGKTLELSQGDAFAQGVFLPFGIAAADTAKGRRTGGFGSTDAASNDR